MVTFKFREVGDALGTRQLGAQVRERLLPLIESNDKVVLDFEGVSVVSNSFADECLAKLLLVMPFEELKRRTTFASVNDFARRNIAIAFRRRMAQVWIYLDIYNLLPTHQSGGFFSSCGAYSLTLWQ